MRSNKLELTLVQLELGVVQLNGALTPIDAEVSIQDELIHFNHPIVYSLAAERLEDSILLRGSVKLVVDCECARCLKQFQYKVELDSWACHIPLEGDDRVEVKGDCVDLTPYIREDIVLALPQHPLCDFECNGLPGTKNSGTEKHSAGPSETGKPKSVWDQLDQLKLR